MKSIIVMGNARSGTSMTAGLLSILGVNMGESPLEEAAEIKISQNPKGFFENPDFTKLTLDMHRDWSSNMSQFDLEEKYESSIISAIRKNECDLWGFKSAAIVPFFSMFAKNMENPYVITTSRNILHNAQSWIIHMRDVFGTNVSFEKSMTTMCDSQKILMETTIEAECPKMFITYEDIKKDPWTEAKRLAEFIDVECEDKKQKVEDLIIPNYTTL